MSCVTNSNTSDYTSEIKNTKAKTIETHDLLMENMGRLRSLKKQILTKDSLNLNSIELLAKIDSADKSMWDWMHQFKVNYEAENDSLTLSYFEDKFNKINEVQLLFDSAIIRSERYINQ